MDSDEKISMSALGAYLRGLNCSSRIGAYSRGGGFLRVYSTFRICQTPGNHFHPHKKHNKSNLDDYLCKKSTYDL